MYLARVIGRVVATRRYEGLSGVPLQWIQPLDENGAAMGDALVACAVVSTGPGDLVSFVDGREAALACPETFVPVDAAIISFVEEAVSVGRHIGREDDPHAQPSANKSPAQSDEPARATWLRGSQASTSGASGSAVNQVREAPRSPLNQISEAMLSPANRAGEALRSTVNQVHEAPRSPVNKIGDAARSPLNQVRERPRSELNRASPPVPNTGSRIPESR